MKKRVFLIHGWGGWPKEGWFPWFKKELERNGFVVTIPEMPNSNTPKMDEWLPHLVSVVGIPDEQTYFIGHSLGNIMILRYLEQLNPSQKIGGVVFVAGFTTDLNIPELQESKFFSKPINWDLIKNHTNKFVAIHSDNDKYVDVKYGDLFKEELNAETIIIHDMKHFSGDDGITQLPEAVESILKLAQ